MFGPVNKACTAGAECRLEEFAAAVLDLARRIFRLHQGLSPGPTMELPKLTGINNHAIYLIKNKQTLYGPIYSLGLMELETLKTYIRTWPVDMSGLLSHQPGF